MKQGQINLNPNAGKLIYDICLREYLNNQKINDEIRKGL